jgi:hypothetical protein
MSCSCRSPLSRAWWRAVGALVAVAAFAAAPAPASAQGVTYTFTGGLISGKLGAYTFTNAVWTLSATIDPTTIQYGTTSSGAPYWRLPSTPSLTLVSSEGTRSTTIAEPWFLHSYNISSFGITGFVWGRDETTLPGFDAADFSGNPWVKFDTILPPLALTYKNASNFAFDDGEAIATTDGALTVTEQTYGDGALCIGVPSSDCTPAGIKEGSGGGTPVPEPASLALLAAGGVALLARRRRAAAVAA